MENLVIERNRFLAPDHTYIKALKLLRSWINGRYEESYTRLLKYLEEIKERNPGTIAMKSEFNKGYKSLIRVDGFFLMRPYKGNFSADYMGYDYINAISLVTLIFATSTYAKLRTLFCTTCNAYTEHAKHTFLLHLKFLDYTTNFMESINVKIEKLRSQITACEAKMLSRGCVVTPARSSIFEVLDGVNSFIMDLNEHHCNCMIWKSLVYLASIDQGAF
ncbi:hypothetical protein Cgig2_026449 [Carnegiea gigantea]|uniref:Uncharacterized protein n=1 Tax=Carnegiea gigantea TaxID=171969 RepID=A0A9Q1GMT0_9CARY|nr:hypothetical protein Cgig2_026449 [Carnegiea gigantea]